MTYKHFYCRLPHYNVAIAYQTTKMKRIVGSQITYLIKKLAYVKFEVSEDHKPFSRLTLKMDKL
jgi:hypothetical protein